ncbi:MAG: hypothetical protein L0H83_14400 [Salinisphaera sp.]|nr:hypothetical protein [Salinisphaera sp.]
MRYGITAVVLAAALAVPVYAQTQGDPEPVGSEQSEASPAQPAAETGTQATKTAGEHDTKPTIQSQPPAPGVAIELNKLEPVHDACRAFIVIHNKSSRRFQTLQLDLVMFDTQGIVAKRLAVDAAPLPPQKTLLKVFDIQALPCDQIGQILLNGVLACRDQNGERKDCLGLLSVTARGGVPFIK